MTKSEKQAGIAQLETPGMRNAPPRASALVEALRGLGYSAATALADVIDNSIAAGASTVDVSFVWMKQDSYVLIVDNGSGMNAAALDSAMRLGEKSPLDVRAADDLGRFGLGLKTASFSQARRLTVASRQEGVTSILRWDLDRLLSDPHGRWLMLEGPDPQSSGRLPALDAAAGTAVLWENLDRIISVGHSEQVLLDVIDRVERHLAMVFHRYLEQRRLLLTINGRKVIPWDPFLSSRTDTWRSGHDSFRVNGYRIGVEGFVLPHRDRLDPKTWENAGGPDGWTAQQGFYIYRNERLLVAGSWLGLGRGRSWTKDEPYRLARIKVDLPNSADADWKIDIRKSTARPPVEARHRLTALAEDVRERARRVFAFRGKPRAAGQRTPLVQAWKTHHLKDGIHYRVDRDHPAISAVLNEAGNLAPAITAMLQVIEQTVPVQQIWLDTAEAKDAPPEPVAEAPPPELQALMQRLLSSFMRRNGLGLDDAKAQLSRTEPFSNWPGHIAQLQISPETKR